MFVVRGAILLLRALKMWRNYSWGEIFTEVVSHIQAAVQDVQDNQVNPSVCHFCNHVCSCWGLCSGRCPRLPPTACLGLGWPQGSPRCSLCCFLHRGLWLFCFLLRSSQVLWVLLCLRDTHTPVPVLPVAQQAPVSCRRTLWAPQGSLLCGL